jgi:hypothetical protein
MNIWRETEEGSDLYDKCAELTALIHQKEDDLSSLRELAFLLANKF